MIRLQEWIHQLEVGAGVRVLRIVLAALVFGVIALVFDHSEFRNLDNPQGMDLAQVARNVSEGRGLTTRWIRPLSVYLVEGRQVASGEAVDAWAQLEKGHPDLANPPGYPLVLGLLMKVFPVDFQIPSGRPFSVYHPDMFIAVVNQVLFLALVILVFWVGARLFDRSVGWMSALVVGGTEMLWQFSISGSPYFLTTFVFMLLVLVLQTAERGARELGWSSKRLALFAVFTGALVACGGMTRYGFLWFILPATIFLGLYFPGKRSLMVVVGLVSFLVCISPWLVRNYSLSGTFFGVPSFQVSALVHETGATDVTRSFGPVIESAPVGLWIERAASEGAAILREQFPYLGGGWLGGLFLAGLLLPFRDPGRGRIRVFVLVVIVTAFLVEAVAGFPAPGSSANTYAQSLLMAVIPMVCIFGAGLFMAMIDQLDLGLFQANQLLSGIAVVVLSLPLLLLLLPPSKNPRAFPPYAPQHVQRFCEWMAEDELVMSDQPWAVAWYGNQVCLSLTEVAAGETGMRSFAMVNEQKRTVKAVYLSPLTLDAPFHGGIFSAKPGSWEDFSGSVLLTGELPEGFPLRHAPREYLRFGHLFLTDEMRWATEEAEAGE